MKEKVILTLGYYFLRTKYFLGCFGKLAKQEDIHFSWKLIITEEYAASFDPLGEKEVMKYIPRLKEVKD